MTFDLLTADGRTIRNVAGTDGRMVAISYNDAHPNAHVVAWRAAELQVRVLERGARIIGPDGRPA